MYASKKRLSKKNSIKPRPMTIIVNKKEPAAEAEELWTFKAMLALLEEYIV